VRISTQGFTRPSMPRAVPVPARASP